LTQISPPTNSTMFFIFSIRNSYMLRAYILAIFRELQGFSTCAVYVVTSYRYIAETWRSCV